MFKKRKNTLLLSLLFIIGIFVFPLISSAQILVPQLDGLTTADIKIVAGSIIQLFLGLLGLIALVIILIAGFKWMTSGGNEEKISEARKMLIAGIVGLIIILASYVITSFILESIQGALNNNENENDQNCSVNVCYGCNRCTSAGDLIYDSTCLGCDSSGSGFDFETTWYSPRSNNVSLCSMIQVKFNALIDQDYFNDSFEKLIQTPGEVELDQDLFHFYECLDYSDDHCRHIGKDLAIDILQFQISGKILQFNLGIDYQADTYYVVDLPLNGIKQEGEDNYLGNGLSWTFKTGSETDNNPPKVINVFPGGAEEVCLNSYIEVEFSEDMDLMSLEDLEAFRLYENMPDDLSNIGFIHNAYSNKLVIYPNRNYDLNHNYFPLLNGDIIKDACGNLLDGDFDGNSEGAPVDNYPSNGPSVAWTFKTGENEYCNPQVTGVSPVETYYDDNVPLQISGHYLLGASLVFDDNIIIDENSNLCLDNNYWPENLCAVGAWQVDEINVFVPADGGDSFGAKVGELSIKLETDQGSVETGVNLLSPRINKLSPDRGGPGQYVSLLGQNFDEVEEINFEESKVFFRLNNDEYLEAELPCAQEGWQDSFIVISVPEELEINTSYRVQIKKVLNNGEEYWSNLVDFYFDDSEAGPGLCSINQDFIEYGDEFLLTGYNLGDGILNRMVILGDDYNSVLSPVVTWGNPVNGQDTTVLAKTPNLSTTNDIGVRVAIERETGDMDSELDFSNYLNVDVISNSADEFYISYISPDSVSVGEYITIYGSGFGNSQGEQTVRFFNNTATWPEGDFDFPTACSSVYWQDDKIIVKVPEVFNTLPFSSQIKVVNNQIETNTVDLEVDNEDPAPSICSVNPSVGTRGNELEIIGEYLNDVDQVTFAYASSNSVDSIPNSTSNNVLSVYVPETNTGLISAHSSSGYGNTWNFEYLEEIVEPGSDWDFYGWEFTTCERCESPRVRIQACDAGLFSPSPAGGNKFVPLDSNIYVEFEYQNGNDAEMDTTSYQNNFTVYNCANEQNPLALEDCDSVPVSNFNGENTFLEINGLNLEAGYWYVVELSNDIKDLENSSLEEYLWYFRIDPYGAVCEPDTLNIKPNNFVKEYISSAHIGYIGLLVDSQNCYVCNSTGYDYAWESSDISLATIDSPTSSTTDVILNEYYRIGDLKIKATSTLGALELVDDTNLYITANCSVYDGNENECLDETDSHHSSFNCCWDAYNQTCENDGNQICNSPFVRNRNCQAVGFGYIPSLASPSPARNSEIIVTDAHIYAEFAKSNISVIMKESTFANGITILNCGTGQFPSLPCSSVNVPNIINIDSVPNIINIDSGSNFVDYSHDGFDENTWYEISLENSITDIYDNPIIPESWIFKTETGTCVTENILLQPSNATIEVNSDMNYGVLCYDNSCNVCDDIYTYNWSVIDYNIATIDESIHTNANKVEGIAVGNTEVKVENNQLDLKDYSKLEVVLDLTPPPSDPCNFYNDQVACHTSGECCWDGETCGSDMSACDEDCLVYNDETSCEADTCCWTNEDCFFENNPVCDSPFLEELNILSHYPEDNAIKVCPNTAINIDFNSAIDLDSLENNIIIEDLNTIIDCLENEEAIKDNLISFKWLKKIFKKAKAFEDLEVCYRKIPFDYYLSYSGEYITSVVNLEIQEILDLNHRYRVTLQDGAEGIKSAEGAILNCSSLSNWASCTWSFTTATSVCDLNYIKIVNPTEEYYEFNKPLIGENFVAEGRTISGDPIVSVAGVYDWQWKWESLDESLVTLVGDNSDSTLVVPANNNGTTRVRVSALPIPTESVCNIYNQSTCEINSCCWVDGTCSSNLETCEQNLEDYNNKAGYKRAVLDDEVEVELFMCENPWEYEDPDYNFKLKYCLDGGLYYLADDPSRGLIINTPTLIGTAEDQLLREYIFKYIPNPSQQAQANNFNLVDARSDHDILSKMNFSEITDSRLSFKLLAKMFSKFIPKVFQERALAAPQSEDTLLDLPNDIIGLRIYQNQSHRAPIDWYNSAGLVSFKGSPSAITIDGYSGLNDGRTVYVNSANVVGNSIYTNVSLISHSQDTEAGTLNIFNQLVDNWNFNTNIDIDHKEDVIEDVKRWEDLRTMEKKLDTYAVHHKYCAYTSDPVGRVCPTYPVQYYYFDIDGNGSVDTGECYNVSQTSVCNTDLECQNNEMGFDKCVGVYPELNEGTYVQGISTSAWPSWASSLGNQLGSSLPVDLVNEFNSCPDPYDQETCWDVVGESFFCPIDSQIYYYQSANSYNIDQRALSFDLYASLNFDVNEGYLWNGDFMDNGSFNSAFKPFNNLHINNSNVCDGQVSSSCGNDIWESGEGCEAGMTLLLCSDYYNATEIGCRYDCQWPPHISDPEDCLSCGDGVFSPEYGEVCEGEQQETFCVDSWNQQTVTCSNCQWPTVGYCQYCGNGICESAHENKITCYADCGDCGDKFCDEENEDAYSCYTDCGFCGDTIVSGPEVCDKEGDIGAECIAEPGGYAGHLQCLDDCSDWDTECIADGDCGDGVVNGNELCEINDIGPQCDDEDGYYGNYVCKATNLWEAAEKPPIPVIPPYESEECFWGECDITESCGDGVINGPEECDDGNNRSGDGCSANCEDELCGNGFVDLGEDCELGDTLSLCSGYYNATDISCRYDCQWPVHINDPEDCLSCGDEITSSEYDEECDDGNEDPHDDCIDCQIAECGDGYIWGGHEECDDADDDNTDRCVADCQLAECGDGYIWDDYEDCDGSDLNGQTCQSLGFSGGTLACTNDAYCSFDTSACSDGISLVGDPVYLLYSSNYHNNEMVEWNNQLCVSLHEDISCYNDSLAEWDQYYTESSGNDSRKLRVWDSDDDGVDDLCFFEARSNHGVVKCYQDYWHEIYSNSNSNFGSIAITSGAGSDKINISLNSANNILSICNLDGDNCDLVNGGNNDLDYWSDVVVSDGQNSICTIDNNDELIYCRTDDPYPEVWYHVGELPSGRNISGTESATFWDGKLCIGTNDAGVYCGNPSWDVNNGGGETYWFTHDETGGDGYWWHSILSDWSSPNYDVYSLINWNGRLCAGTRFGSIACYNNYDAWTIIYENDDQDINSLISMSDGRMCAIFHDRDDSEDDYFQCFSE